MRLGWLVVAALGGGCVHPDLVDCANGNSCPAGKACDDVHGGCVDPGQLDACATAAPLADCQVGDVVGGCFDGVCLPRGCGNGIVEPGEACDDGNTLPKDGCSSDCRSDETCGNGILDPGEDCDDGGLMSADGCDSRCRIETQAWSAATVLAGPMTADALASAVYDPGHDQLVFPTGWGTWEYDHAWHREAGAPMAMPQSSGQPVGYFDATLQRVVWVASTGLEYQWDGTHSTQLATPPPTGGYDAFQQMGVYDAAHARFVTISRWTGGVFGIDATGWHVLPGLASAGSVSNALAVYEPSTHDIVIVASSFSSGVEEAWFDSDQVSAWQLRASPGIPSTANLAAIGVIGGVANVLLDDGSLYKRQGAANPWVLVESTAPKLDAAVMYVDGSQKVHLFGVTSSGLGQACVRQPTAWTCSPLFARLDDVGWAPAQPATLLGGGAVWTLSPGAATGAAPAASIFETEPGTTWQPSELVYVPERHRLVAVGTLCKGTSCILDAWELEGIQWFEIPGLPTANGYPQAMAYDPETRATEVVLGFQANMWFELAGGAAAWGPSQVPQSGFGGNGVRSLAWDAANGRFVALASGGGSGQQAFELTGTTWSPLTLAPIEATALLGDERTRGLLWFGYGYTWERHGDNWKPLPAYAESGFFPDRAAYDASTGSALLVGSTADNGVVALIRAWTGSAPMESCTADVDADGDGLTACRDPDCYWATLACP